MGKTDEVSFIMKESGICGILVDLLAHLPELQNQFIPFFLHKCHEPWGSISRSEYCCIFCVFGLCSHETIHHAGFISGQSNLR